LLPLGWWFSPTLTRDIAEIKNYKACTVLTLSWFELGDALSPNSKISRVYFKSIVRLPAFATFKASNPGCEWECRTMWSPLVVVSLGIVLIAALRVVD